MLRSKKAITYGPMRKEAHYETDIFTKHHPHKPAGTFQHPVKRIRQQIYLYLSCLFGQGLNRFLWESFRQ
jgi:hypothetical protein